MQKKSSATISGENAAREPAYLLKRIGSTTYKVSIHFSERSEETLEDKILRLIEREVSKTA